MLNSFQLRIIALICMCIDHAALVLFPDSAFYAPCRMIGCLAFPLFAWLLYQGYLHTSDFKAYAGRLLRCACISQPLWMMFFGFLRLNVCFSLLFCLLFLYAFDHFREAPRRHALLMFFCLFLSCLSEFGMYSIALVLSYSLWDGHKPFLLFFCGLLCICMSWSWHGCAAFALLFIVCYTGKRGPSFPAYVAYGFYPAHLAVLFLLGCIRILCQCPA